MQIIQNLLFFLEKSGGKMGKMGKNLVLSNKSGLPLAVPFDFIYNEILVGLKMKFFCQLFDCT